MKNLFKKWISGSATWAEEQKLRKSAQKDSFLAEALEGYDAFPTSDHQATIDRLKGRIPQKKKEEKGMVNYLPRVAAIAAMIALVSTFIFIQSSLEQPETMVENMQPIPSEQPPLETFADASPVDEVVDKPIAVIKENSLTETPKKEAPTAPVAAKKPTPKPSVPTSNNLAKKEKIETVSPQSDAGAIAANDAVLEETTITSTEPKQEEIPEIQASEPATYALEEANDLPLAPVAIPEAKPIPEPSISYAESEQQYEDTPPATAYQRSASKKRSKATKTNFYVGAVYNEDGQPMNKVNISAPNGLAKTATQTTGTFVLKSGQPLNQITISKDGFHSRNIELNQYSDYLNVVLTQKSTQVEEADLSLMAPKPVNGLAAFEAYLNENLIYPETAKEKGIQREVEVKFYIDENGTPTKLKAKTADKYGFDKEAIRLLKEGPKWQPLNSHAKYYVTFELN